MYESDSKRLWKAWTKGDEMTKYITISMKADRVITTSGTEDEMMEIGTVISNAWVVGKGSVRVNTQNGIIWINPMEVATVEVR